MARAPPREEWGEFTERRGAVSTTWGHAGYAPGYRGTQGALLLVRRGACVCVCEDREVHGSLRWCPAKDKPYSLYRVSWFIHGWGAR